MEKVTIAEIKNNHLCTGCGVCISEMIDKNTHMKWNEHGFLTPDGEGVFESKATRVCPFNPLSDEVIQDEDAIADIFLKKAPNRDPLLGYYYNFYVGYSKEYRQRSSSGGLATYVFKQLLLRKEVDCLFVVQETNGSYEYQIFEDVNSIEMISKTRYIPVTLEKLFPLLEKLPGRIAVSGVACFIKAIRLKQYYHPELKRKIPFLVGLICGGMKSRFYSDFLASSAGIAGAYSMPEYRLKDSQSTASDYSFGAYDSRDCFHSVKMSTLGDMWGTGLFKANACDFCDDVVTELADISLGDAWINPYSLDGKGTSIIISRSELAEQLIKNGLANEELELENLSIDQLKESQQGSFNHRHKGLAYRLKQLKKKGLLIPNKRKRFISKRTPFEFKLVQKNRMILREASILTWINTKNAIGFNKEISQKKATLLFYTRLYHLIRKIKRIVSNE